MALNSNRPATVNRLCQTFLPLCGRSANGEQRPCKSTTDCARDQTRKSLVSRPVIAGRVSDVGTAQILWCTSAQCKSAPLSSSLTRVAAHLKGQELHVDPAQRDMPRVTTLVNRGHAACARRLTSSQQKLSEPWVEVGVCGRGCVCGEGGRG